MVDLLQQLRRTNTSPGARKDRRKNGMRGASASRHHRPKKKQKTREGDIRQQRERSASRQDETIPGKKTQRASTHPNRNCTQAAVRYSKSAALNPTPSTATISKMGNVPTAQATSSRPHQPTWCTLPVPGAGGSSAAPRLQRRPCWKVERGKRENERKRRRGGKYLRG